MVFIWCTTIALSHFFKICACIEYWWYQHDIRTQLSLWCNCCASPACMMPAMMSETSSKYCLEAEATNSDVTGCEKNPDSLWMTGVLDECRAESVDSADTEHSTSSFRQSIPSQASFKASDATSLASLETVGNLSSANKAALTADRQNMTVTQSRTGAAGHKGWYCIPCCHTAEGTPIEVTTLLSLYLTDYYTFKSIEMKYLHFN